MKKSRLYFSVCLVCMLLLSSSLIAHAEDKRVLENYNIYQYSIDHSVSGDSYIYQMTFYPHDGNILKGSGGFTVNSPRSWGQVKIDNYIGVNDNTIIIREGEQVNVHVENMSMYVNVGGTVLHVPSVLNGCVFYTDGTVGYFSPVVTDKGYPNIDVKFTFKAEKDVEKFLLSATFEYVPFVRNYPTNINVQFGEWDERDDYNTCTVYIEDVNTGLLGGILGKLQEVKDKITGVVDSITELPQKIWQFIENGLKSLFVPSEDFIISYKDKWDELLENRFGAIYQVATLMYDFWGRLEDSYQQASIEVPEVTIPLPDDNEFTFGGYEVDIVPNGFQFLADLVQLATSIVSTYLVMNGLRKRYESVVGG